MSTAHVAQKSPFPLDVEAGKTYYWCACGLSKKQPLCDGSHKPTSFTPVAYTADKPARRFSVGARARTRSRCATAATRHCEIRAPPCSPLKV